MDIIISFVYKHKFMQQVKSQSINFQKICKLDQLRTFTNDDVYVDEVLRSKIGTEVGKFKCIIGVFSINLFFQSQSNLNIHLPQFDALCRRIYNFFTHKKLGLDVCLSKKSYKMSNLITTIEQYGMKMDYSEKQNLKELSYAIEGLECKSSSDDSLKVSSNKLVEYIMRFKKTSVDSYKPKKEDYGNKENDPIEENEKKLLENKLSKEKMKNIELRDKLKASNSKSDSQITTLEKKEKQISDLSKQVSSVMKENLNLSEKIRKGKSNENIPFKQIDELQSLKSDKVKLELDVKDKEKAYTILLDERNSTDNEYKKLQIDHKYLDDL